MKFVDSKQRVQRILFLMTIVLVFVKLNLFALMLLCDPVHDVNC